MLASWIGPMELIVILVIVLLLFGASQIPRLMRSLGQGVHEFKKGIEEGNKDQPATDAPKKAEETKPQEPPKA
jgi:sec-independent protein translocase protein TatA